MDRENPKREFERLRLTRRRVAREELDCAISLFLSNNDPVATNLLAWAAVDVLRGLCDSKGEKTFLSHFEDSIRPEYHLEWRRAVKDHHNFLKHSSKDPDRVIDDFIPEASSYAILCGVEDYRKLFGEIAFPMHVFRAWFMARNPDVMKPQMAALFEGAKSAIGDIHSMSLSRSVRSAGDVLEIFREHPSEIHERFSALGGDIEW